LFENKDKKMDEYSKRKCSKYLEYQFMLHQMRKEPGLPIMQRTIAQFQAERLSKFYYNNCVEERVLKNLKKP
jgi:hypothetical protein